MKVQHSHGKPAVGKPLDNVVILYQPGSEHAKTGRVQHNRDHES
jgi:hypothetical protein